MNKPKIFTWLDFFTFGSLAVITIALDIIVCLSNVTFQAMALMSFLALIFLVIYVYLLIMRKRSIDSCDFFTECGWGVRNNSKTFITKEAVDAEIKKTRDLWNNVIAWDDYVEASLKKHYMIVFEDGVGNIDGIKVAGTIIAARFSAFDGQILIYKMDTLTLQNSALKHEIGHIIYSGKYGTMDNEPTHQFMEKHNLP